jgi:hypothetical protein
MLGRDSAGQCRRPVSSATRAGGARPPARGRSTADRWAGRLPPRPIGRCRTGPWPPAREALGASSPRRRPATHRAPRGHHRDERERRAQREQHRRTVEEPGNEEQRSEGPARDVAGRRFARDEHQEVELPDLPVGHRRVERDASLIGVRVDRGERRGRGRYQLFTGSSPAARVGARARVETVGEQGPNLGGRRRSVLVVVMHFTVSCVSTKTRVPNLWRRSCATDRCSVLDGGAGRDRPDVGRFPRVRRDHHDAIG